METKELHDYLHNRRTESQSLKGKITSLELLQQHAMGKDNKNLNAWLDATGLANKQRLAEFVEVENGWDTAVELVLNSYLEAICVDNIDDLTASLVNLDKESITLFENKIKHIENQSDINATQCTLLSKIKSQSNVSSLLSGIYCANTLDEARRFALTCQAHESIITPDGTWLGSNWLKISHAKDNKLGVLQREKALREFKARLEQISTEIETFEEQLSIIESELKEAEILRESLQQQDNKLGTELSLKSAEFSAYKTQWEHQQRRLENISNDLDEILRESNEYIEAIAEAKLLQEEAELILEQQDEIKVQLEDRQQQLQNKQKNTEATINEYRQLTYSLKAKRDALKASESANKTQIERLRLQHQQSVEWLHNLEAKLQLTLSPLDTEKTQLTEQIAEKAILEKKLLVQREIQDTIEAEITELAETHTRVQRELEKQKELLDVLRFEYQECKVRQQTLSEQLKEFEAEPEQILATLTEQADEAQWKYKVDDLTGQIERLGTINLTAIEEYKAQSERMNFLNEQHADLLEALQLLDQAINKIDKESRLRFKETFDKINTGLQEKFPKLFGGGQAYLELTEQDLLESGVNIIARPPGKRNSSIHLLSGGEKALTAVALVFSIFELNPAPFCLLDEVDAPLDDANVGRFSKMVEEMSKSVQFLYISHNKVTMEIAKQLAGVTMKEPGVSRMVAVDIEEAINLAEV